MTFTVSYRGPDGTIREERIEATGRSECFAQCRTRGIAPVRVKEGMNDRGKAPPSGALRNGEAGRGQGKAVNGGAKTPSVVSRTLLVAAALVILVGGVWWWMTEREDDRLPKVEQKILPTTLVKQEIPKSGETAVTNATVKEVVVSNLPVQEVALPVHVPKYTNIAYRSVARGVVSLHGKPVSPHRRLFKHSSERAIQKVLLVKPGAKVIGNPIPRNFDENFRESLKTEITFDPEDTPEDIEMKKSMIAVKKELAERMAKGDSPSEVLKSEIAELRRLAKYRSNLQKQVNEMKREGTEQDAADLKKAANQMLQENGLKPLPDRQIKAE